MPDLSSGVDPTPQPRWDRCLDCGYQHRHMCPFPLAVSVPVGHDPEEWAKIVPYQQPLGIWADEGGAPVGHDNPPDDAGCEWCTTNGLDHRRVGSKPFAVWVSPDRDSDGQLTSLTVSYAGGYHVGEGEAEYVRRALRSAAVVPVLEKQLRGEIAEQIESVKFKGALSDHSDIAYNMGLAVGARFARGDS